MDGDLAIEIVTGRRPNRSSDSELDLTGDVLAKYTEQRVSQGLAKQDSGSLPKISPADLPTTELAELFLNIHSTISHLFELSMLIRRDRPRGRIGSYRQGQSATNNRPDIVNATDKFPTLHHRRWLAERLGNLVAQRREYIRYRQSHRRDLAHYSVPDQDPTESRTTTKATTFNEVIGHDSPIEMSSVETRSLVSVTTSFATTSEGVGGSGRKIPELADMWLDGNQLGYNTYIECPYCRTIQIIRDRRDWKYAHSLIPLSPQNLVPRAAH